MFMDVRGFTPISEALTATELVDFINTLLAPLSDAIQDELGTIDKYIGDSIMAFWNAPVDVSDHATRACRAALKMRAALSALNDADVFGFSARGFDDSRVKIGVGINAGLACVGNMGSQRRFNYSAMGDVVNVAARIESASKALNVDLLVSEDVVRRVKGIALLEAGEILLKGKSRPTKIYAIAGDDTMAGSPEFAELKRQHGALLTAIKTGEGLDATVALARCQELAGEDMQDFYRRLAEQIVPLRATPSPVPARKPMDR
jgi:adenylate cyclase